jgi:peptidoglycan/LPS O-acetylase OafA/YrhL
VPSDKRLSFLDAQRGVAIALVLLYHAYVRWPRVVPYGFEFADIPLFAYGWVGVQLFFMISGFVIFMTLERCSNFQDFFLRRWLRLFPAMLACSIIDFATAGFLAERPLGMPVLRDLVPGITFIEPDWLGAALHSPQGELEGAFWSLYVEVKFYAIFGLLYFLIGGEAAIAVLIGLFAVPVAIAAAGAIPLLQGLDLELPRELAHALSFEHFGWFAAGALFYRYHKAREPRLLSIAVACALASAATIGGESLKSYLPGMAIVVLFAESTVSERFQEVLNRPVLLWLGFVSYPLYLIHENMMVALIAKVGRAEPWLPDIAMPLIPMLTVMAIAWITARIFEPGLRKLIRPLYDRFRAAIHA